MISVSTDQAVVQIGASAQVTAWASNGTVSSNVNWSVTCAVSNCGTLSSPQTATGTATTYTAPSGADTPASDLTVTITATMVNNPGATASTQLIAKGGTAINGGIVISNGTVLAGSTAQASVTLVNDTAKRGVSWSVSCATPPCGTIAPSTSTSGVSVTYTAPTAIPPADLSVTITATAVSNPSQQAAQPITVPALAITVSAPSPSSLQAAATTQITAMVNYPAPISQDISWTLHCVDVNGTSASDCGSIAPSPSTSGTAVTYTAPATPPPSDLTVTVTATAVAAPSPKATATITITAISVAVSPGSALLPLNTSQDLAANVGSDPTSGGVTWSLMQGTTSCGAACGTVAPSATASGAAATYTAPAVLPVNPAVSVTATSVEDKTKSGAATIRLTTGSVKLVPFALQPFSWRCVRIQKKLTCRGSSQTVALTNTGAGALTISGITIGGTNPAAFSQINDCSSSVVAGSSCSITVKLGQNGVNSAVLSINDSSTDSPQQVNLTTQPVMTATSRAAVATRPVAAVPSPSGANMVGTRLVHLVDSKRADPYLANGGPRELMVRFWYPAVTGAGCRAADYTSPQVWEYFATLVGAPVPQVSTHSCLNSAAAAGKHPVVVVTHGFTGTATDYTFLAEDLASRGYVVAAVNHTHEATAVEFPDGRLEKSVFGSHLTEYTRSDPATLEGAVAVRLDDLRFVLDELARLNAASGGDLSGRLDLARIALLGHSLGGLTTVRALEREPRIRAGVLLDSFVAPSAVHPVQQPVLSLMAGHEGWQPDDCRLWDALQGPRVAMNLPGAEHIALSDAIWLLSGAVTTGTAGPDVAVAAIRGYVASFLDVTLRGRALPAWGMSTTHYPGVEVASGAQSLCRAQ